MLCVQIYHVMAGCAHVPMKPAGAVSACSEVALRLAPTAQAQQCSSTWLYMHVQQSIARAENHARLHSLHLVPLPLVHGPAQLLAALAAAAELQRAPDGGILVGANLESVSTPGVFAAGDCCT